jgi:hypothetical protein
MKVNFRNMINGYTGQADDVIYVYDRQTNRYYVRSYPCWKEKPFNVSFRDKMANLQRLNPYYKYKEDMQIYVELYNALAVNKYNPVKAWNNLFMKVMFSMEKTIPDVNLSTITKAEIYARELPCISVMRAVEGGLLPEVKGYERFSNGI